MADKKLITVDPLEYQKKRYEISKDILASNFSNGGVQEMTEIKQREAAIFNCVQLADMLLLELGYVQYKKGDGSIHNLAQILKNDKGDEE
jgi:hypothetical protein